ncbi:rod shape-determining protein MreC [Pseudoalteromonas denitrificans]|uniref:Cell shape-determining protein MreC n=1 Tax=Pseudoalteromonas denitrificans DSM 6059 TaxID=1123010 RepID=A0A1I1R744_9GAMM|nr:rod shape-determining protein MreC [Pseudoalteromonas denitrificans]SFD30007.1 rod shape-determining protein MreC [Pseudoalteromonas denitrificans DSM 6059]
MNLLFGRNASLQLRLVIAVVLSGILMVGDKYTSGASTIRTSLNTLVSPLFYFANIPSEFLSWSSQNLESKKQLLAENSLLKTKQLLLNEKLQQFQFLQNENSKLRALLNSTAKPETKKIVTKVLSIHSNTYSQQVVINKGFLDNVIEGQAVVDDLGIVGKVVQVGSTTSRVLLMTDNTHAIPVRVLRNNVRTVVEGVGKLNQVELPHVPHSMDIRMGDILVSSGLGDLFPEGFPVATITKIERDESKPFAKVYAEPIAQLDRIRLLVLLWSQQVKVEKKDE